MQKTKAKLPVLIISVLVIGACFLRFFQLLKIPDVNADTITSYSKLSYSVYAILALVFAALLAVAVKKPVICDVGLKSRRIAVSSLTAAAGMFIDFVNQCFTCVNYFNNTRYVEYGYIIPLAASGVLAIINCYYLICISLTARGRNLDFRKLGLLNLSIILFGVARLITITTAIVDVRQDIDSSLEFLFLIFIVFMWFGYISFMEDSVKSKAVVFTVSSAMSFCIAIVFFVPYLLYAFVNRDGLINATTVSAVSYMTMGVFSISLLSKNKN